MASAGEIDLASEIEKLLVASDQVELWKEVLSNFSGSTQSATKNNGADKAKDPGGENHSSKLPRFTDKRQPARKNHYCRTPERGFNFETPKQGWRKYDVWQNEVKAFVKSLDIISLIYKAHSKEYSLSFDDSSVAHVHILPDHVIAEL